MTQGQKQAERAHIKFIALVGIRADEFVVTRFTNNKAFDMGTKEFGDPSGKGTGFQGENDTLAPQSRHALDKVFGCCSKADRTRVHAIRSQGAQNSGCGVQIQCGKESRGVHGNKTIDSTWRKCHAMIFAEIKHDSPNACPSGGCRTRCMRVPRGICHASGPASVTLDARKKYLALTRVASVIPWFHVTIGSSPCQN